MKHFFLKHGFSLIFGALVLTAGAQELEVDKDNKIAVKDPVFDTLLSPNASIGSSKKFTPKNWLEVEVELQVEKLKEEPKDKYLDEVKVNYYLVVKGQDRKLYLIKRTVTHVNVPTDEPVVSAVYLSPNTLKRITGSNRSSKRDIEAIGGEVELNGRMVGFFTYGLKAGWWRSIPERVELTEKFPLLDRTQTPFAPFWYDRYAEVKPKNE